MTLFDKKKAIDLSEKMGEKASEKDVDEIEEKLPLMKRGPVAKIWDKVLRLWEAFKDPSTPVWKKTTIIGGLIYLILPLDLIADVIPGVGLVDDVFVVLFVFKQVFEIATKKVIEKIKEPVDRKIKEKLDEKLNQAIKNMVKSIAVTFLIMTIGLLFVIFKPWGQDIAFVIAAVIFIGLMIWGTINTVRSVKIAWPWIVSVWNEKDIKKGVIAEVKAQYRAAAVYDTVLEIGSKFIHALDEIPDLEQILSHYVRYFRRKLIIVAIAVAVYTMAVYWILKPLLISEFGGLKMWQLYIYPVTHIIKVFKGF